MHIYIHYSRFLILFLHLNCKNNVNCMTFNSFIYFYDRSVEIILQKL